MNILRAHRSLFAGVLGSCLIVHPPPLQAQTTQAPAVEVVEVKLDGATSLTPAERQEIEQGLTGASSRADWLDKLKEETSKFLADQGFLSAKVTLSAEPLPDHEGNRKMRLMATINEGPRFHVAQVWWAGVSNFSVKELADVILLKSGDVFRPSLAVKSTDMLRAYYVAKGYKNASVISQVQPFLEDGVVALYIEIQEKALSQPQPLKSKSSQLRSPQDCRVARPAARADLPVTHYDPKRNGQADLIAAKREAKRTNRNVLMVVGGEWCGWCRVFDDTFEKVSDLRTTRDANFVTVYINFSEQNHNPCAFVGLPEPKTFPKVYVLDSAGRLLRTDDTSDWQFAGGYDPRRIALFLTSASKEKAPAVTGAGTNK